MHKLTQTFVDHNGKTQTEDFYFDFDETEVLEMELREDGGLSAQLEKIVVSENVRELMSIFKDIVLDAYGQKSEDGRLFRKNPSLRQEFRQHKAFSAIYIGLATDDKLASEFINGIVPDDMILPEAIARAEAKAAGNHPSLQGYQKKERRPVQEADLPHVGSDDIEDGDHVAIAPEEFKENFEDYTGMELTMMSPERFAAVKAHFGVGQ